MMVIPNVIDPIVKGTVIEPGGAILQWPIGTANLTSLRSRTYVRPKFNRYKNFDGSPNRFAWGEFMRKKRKKSLNRRRFLKAAGSGAAFVGILQSRRCT